MTTGETILGNLQMYVIETSAYHSLPIYRTYSMVFAEFHMKSHACKVRNPTWRWGDDTPETSRCDCLGWSHPPIIHSHSISQKKTQRDQRDTAPVPVMWRETIAAESSAARRFESVARLNCGETKGSCTWLCSKKERRAVMDGTRPDYQTFRSAW